MRSVIEDVREKVIPAPVPPLKDRSFMKFIAEGNNADGFQFLQFRVDAPSSASLFRLTRVVLPIRARFKNDKQESVYHDGIALKASYLDRIFRTVSVSYNGQDYRTAPIEKLHHYYVSPSSKRQYQQNDGCLLPVLQGPDISTKKSPK